MASGPLPKRVVCPACGAPEGIPCRDPETKGPVRKPHPARTAAAALWYDRQSPDGLTPRRRDEMVEALQRGRRGKGDVGRLMEKITKARDPEAEFARLVAAE